ncbi:MAG: hypothetical protein O3C45_07690 [Bacteroidetes bacterium]|nr:hypothetical protein [Bacteroidota bacterium]
MRTFFVILALAVMAFGIYGCEDEQDRRDAERAAERASREAERASREVERSAREVERSVDRELERAEAELERVREKLEDRLESKELTDEEIERIAQDVEESVTNGLARLGEVLDQIGTRIQEDADVQVVDFRDFRDLLPSDLMDMERVDWEGANKSALGMRFSKLEASYEAGNNRMDIAILDLGTMKGLAAMGFDFIDKEIDQEDRNGFKRTREFEGWPGLETVEFHDGHRSFTGVLIVEKRFVIAVEAQGDELDKDFLEDLFADLDINDLERMAR